jgi:N-acetyl-anhydromuramyl-L-alanine amidase AmpD
MTGNSARECAAMILPTLKWRTSPNFGARSTAVDLIVLHDTEGGYQGAIATFANSHSQVSAHLVLREDGLEATQMVGYREKAWHVKAFNSRAIGIEMAGFLARGLEAAEWTEAAEITAYLCHRFSVPAVWSQGGKFPGVCRHYDLGRAGGGHQDPTQSLTVWRAFMSKVGEAFKAKQWPIEQWGRD